MKRNKAKRTVNRQLISQAKNKIGDAEQYDDAVSKASAEYYERCWKSRIKDRQLDIWIAVGLYLVLSSVAFVVL